MKKQILILTAVVFLLCMAGCGEKSEGEETVQTYTQIDQDTAKSMMEQNDGHIIVDVRRQDEYDAGHIPGAILIPNESIGCDSPEALPDYDQTILIYCRSGNRSKQAAQKLAEMGYRNVYEFGGIIDWTGEIVTESTNVVLTFDSFDGGGPEYEIVLDSDIVTYTSTREYARPDYKELDGAGFTVLFTFTGVKPGEAAMMIEERSPIGGNLDHRYSVKVDNNLNVSIEELELIDLDEIADAIQPVPTLVIAANGKVFYAALEDNSSAEVFAENLTREAIEVDMHDYGGFEKVGPLPWELPRNDESIITEPGDVILYQGNQITVYYGQNSWNFTRLAKIGNVTGEELRDALGDGNVTVAFRVEWSE